MAKDAKRRREARLEWQQLAAEKEMDAKISQDVGRTLNQADVYTAPPHTLPRPTPVSSTMTLPSPPTVQPMPTPPQHPPFDFGDLFGDFDIVNEMRKWALQSGPLTPPFHLPQVQSFRPPQPSSLRSSGKFSNYPIVSDLSKLPEPVRTSKPEPRCEELQLWEPKISPQPEKVSRFFPPPPPPKPKVKLPPTRPKLHQDDTGIQDYQPPDHFDAAGSVELKADDAEMAPMATPNEDSEECAANLWRILRSPENGTCLTYSDPYTSSFAYRWNETVFTTPSEGRDHKLGAVGVPAELENTEIPYVHANSLTGVANQCASIADTNTEDAIMFDSPVCMKPVDELLYGMNELTLDPYVDTGSTESLPPLPTSPRLEAVESSLWDAELVNDISDGGEAEWSGSTAHFGSEQSLFDLKSDRNIVPLARFLAMGHAPNCWCPTCDESCWCSTCNNLPELVEDETPTENEGWSMVYSNGIGTRSSSVWSD